MNPVSALAQRVKRRRTWRDVWGSILKCLAKGNATQNRIMTSTNLNVRVTRNYLRDLTSSEFVHAVSQSKGRKVYSITETGKKWLGIYKTLLALEKSKN